MRTPSFLNRVASFLPKLIMLGWSVQWQSSSRAVVAFVMILHVKNIILLDKHGNFRTAIGTVWVHHSEADIWVDPEWLRRLDHACWLMHMKQSPFVVLSSRQPFAIGSVLLALHQLEWWKPGFSIPASHPDREGWDARSKNWRNTLGCAL